MHAIHTVLRLTLKTKQKRFYLFAVWEYEKDNCRFISFLKYVKMEGYSTNVPTIAATTFQTIGSALRANLFSEVHSRCCGVSIGLSGTP